jgi:hypothetical protein
VKPIKMLGFAALAALMAMAFVGVSSAMAESTALCKEDATLLTGEACPAGKLVTHMHAATVSGSPERLLSSIVETLCDVLFLGDAGSLGAPQTLLGTFTLSNCMTASGGSCTATETSSDAKFSVLKLGHELGDFSVTQSWNIHCGFFINCTYDGEGLGYHILGALLSPDLNGDVTISEQTTHRVSGICPETAKLDLQVTPLTELGYIAK